MDRKELSTMINERMNKVLRVTVTPSTGVSTME